MRFPLLFLKIQTPEGLIKILRYANDTERMRKSGIATKRELDWKGLYGLGSSIFIDTAPIIYYIEPR